MLASSRMTGHTGGTQRTIYVSLRRDEGNPPYKYDLCAACSARAAGTQCAPLRSLQSKNMCSSFMNQITNCVNQIKNSAYPTNRAAGKFSRSPCLIALVLLLSLNCELIQRSYTHRGCGSASSSCRGTFRQCRTQLPSPAHAWPCWDRTSTRQYRRGGAGQ